MSDEDKPITVSSTSTYNFLRQKLESGKFSLLGGVVKLRHSKRPPPDHTIYALVGQVASEWAHLEHFLDLIIWELAGVPDREGACITAQLMGASPRYRTIIAQLTLRSKQHPKFERFITKVNSLNGQTYDPQERRNRIIHDPWYVTFDDGPGLLTAVLSEKPGQFKSMPAKDLRFGIEDVDLNDIGKTLTDIKLLAEKVGKLRSEILDEIAASKQKQI